MKLSLNDKILYYLVSTMNLSFPDYDFSDLAREHFIALDSLSDVVNSINTTLFNIGINKNMSSFSDLSKRLWDCLDDVIGLVECSIFSFLLDLNDSDPFCEEDTIWSFNYFFWNKRLKRILLFYCHSFGTSDDLSRSGPSSCQSSQSDIRCNQ